MGIINWIKSKLGKKEPEPEKLPHYIAILPQSDYPNLTDLQLEFHQLDILEKLNSYYFHQIVRESHLVSAGKSSNENLLKLTAQHTLINKILESHYV